MDRMMSYMTHRFANQEHCDILNESRLAIIMRVENMKAYRSLFNRRFDRIAKNMLNVRIMLEEVEQTEMLENTYRRLTEPISPRCSDFRFSLKMMRVWTTEQRNVFIRIQLISQRLTITSFPFAIRKSRISGVSTSRSIQHVLITAS